MRRFFAWYNGLPHQRRVILPVLAWATEWRRVTLPVMAAGLALQVWFSVWGR